MGTALGPSSFVSVHTSKNPDLSHMWNLCTRPNTVNVKNATIEGVEPACPSGRLHGPGLKYRINSQNERKLRALVSQTMALSL